MFIGVTAVKLTSNRLEKVRKTVRASTSIIAVAFFLFFPAEGLQAEEPPIVKVNFQLEGKAFRRMSTNDIETIKLAAENKLCELNRVDWGFLNWSNSKVTRSDAEWNIVLKALEKPTTTISGEPTTGIIATLNHSGALASNQYPFKQTEEMETIYPLGQTPPIRYVETFKSDINSWLGKQLEVLLKDSSVKIFLENIPIVNKVIADKANTRYVIPIKSLDLHTSVNSLLRVQFKNSNNVDHFKVQTAWTVDEADQQYGGYIKGKVTDTSIQHLSIVTPTEWSPELSTVIETATEVLVYMEIFNPSISALTVDTEGVVEEPEQGVDSP